MILKSSPMLHFSGVSATCARKWLIAKVHLLFHFPSGGIISKNFSTGDGLVLIQHERIAAQTLTP